MTLRTTAMLQQILCVIVLFQLPCSQQLCLQFCKCTTSPSLTDSTLLTDSTDIIGTCLCPEHGIIERKVYNNVRVLNLEFSYPVVLNRGDLPEFTRIWSLIVTGMQFVEAGGFHGLGALVRLTLHNNYMRVLETGMFTDLEKLEYLQVDQSGTKSILALENGTFSGLHKLLQLHLKGHAIVEIEGNHFRGLQSLRELDLSDNRLTQIKGSTFIFATSLTDLNLSGNMIKVVHWHAFLGLTKLENLRLNNNSIEIMSRPVFTTSSIGSTRSAPISLHLDGNPLRCDCHLNWIANWNRYHCNGYCFKPDKLHGQSIAHVYARSLQQCTDNNPFLSILEGRRVELQCPIVRASWVTPGGHLLQNPGDCEDPFYLTSIGSLVIWKASIDTAGNYSCSSPESSAEYVYQLAVEKQPLLTAWQWALVVGCFFLVALIIVSIVARCTNKPRLENRPPDNGVGDGDGNQDEQDQRNDQRDGQRLSESQGHLSRRQQINNFISSVLFHKNSSYINLDKNVN